jgi:hypothetical protein
MENISDLKDVVFSIPCLSVFHLEIIRQKECCEYNWDLMYPSAIVRLLDAAVFFIAVCV